MSASERLTCEAMFRMLAGHSHGQLSPVEEVLVLVHLEECPVCAREAAFERSLDAALRQKLTALTAPPGLMDRIRRQLRGPARPDR